MSSREMFSLWWKEKWVRYLVISISPIGLIDAIYTILLFNSHGPHFEYNPIVRLALTSDFWLGWVIIDIVSFLLFSMIAGSYYLHTRSRIFSNHTGWLAFLIALRIGTAMYNVFVFYAIIPSVFFALILGSIAFVIVHNLLGREKDISWRGFKGWFQQKYHRIHDYLLIRGTKKTKTGSEEELESTVVVEEEPTADNTGVWLRRALYMSMALLVFVSTPFVLTIIADITGISQWQDLYGGPVFFNELSSIGFLTAFVAILVLISIMMYFILKSFDTTEGAW